ncbi:MAG: hypothetical protein KIT56_02760 [Gammaproteobacteria bacterium]|nr:hypothetical protein [Gammaproteobacteria bacterium]MCW5582798.1 hypothetical protein [Gammaproteobacteria bacterium]
MKSNTLLGKQLTPKEVYCGAIGAFIDARYELKQIIINPSTGDEKARVYEKDGKSFILYYPGKDNDKPETISNPTTPLKSIIQEADKQLKTLYSIETLKKAQKLFIVAESNRHLGVKVKHFIKADLYQDILTTEDSIDRNYDETYITDAIPHQKRLPIKSGWQKLSDSWQCGHFVIAALSRDIKGEKTPRKFQITSDIVQEHSRLISLGASSVQEQLFQKTQPVTDMDGSDDDFSISKEESDTDTDPDPWKEDRNNGTEEWNGKKSTKKQPKSGFFKRHPWVRDVLIGAAIGLAVVGAIAITAITLGGALPVVLGAGATVGATFGLSGAVATGVGLATIGVSCTAAFAAIAGGVGAVTRMFTKRKNPRKVKDQNKVDRSASISFDDSFDDSDRYKQSSIIIDEKDSTSNTPSPPGEKKKTPETPLSSAKSPLWNHPQDKQLTKEDKKNFVKEGKINTNIALKIYDIAEQAATKKNKGAADDIAEELELLLKSIFIEENLINEQESLEKLFLEWDAVFEDSIIDQFLFSWDSSLKLETQEKHSRNKHKCAQIQLIAINLLENRKKEEEEQAKRADNRL